MVKNSVKSCPYFSILINCHNGAKFLEQALESVSSQSFRDYEVVFVDNCSTDQSAQIAKKFDGNLKYVKTASKVALGHARKIGVDHCEGDWIAFLDTDDLWHPNKLSFQKSIVDAHPDVKLVYGGVTEIDEHGKSIRDVRPQNFYGDKLGGLLLDFDVNMVTPVINRAFLEENALNFSEEIMASEEYHLFMRVAALVPIFSTDEILGSYRVYGNSLTFKARDRWHIERKMTLDALSLLAPDKVQSYAREMEYASARGYYYRACWEMSVGKYAQAWKTMASITSVSAIYKPLFICSFFPPLWHIIHKPLVRRYLMKLYRK